MKELVDFELKKECDEYGANIEREMEWRGRG